MVVITQGETPNLGGLFFVLTFNYMCWCWEKKKRTKKDTQEARQQ